MAAEPDLNAGALAPVADEVDLRDLPVQGRLPGALSGMLVRNGPNPHSGVFVGEGMLNWWPEAAMLHGVQFAAGELPSYRNRWLRTEGWARHFADDAEQFPQTNPNVNVIRHAGIDLALAEGGPPLQISPDLATGAVPPAFTAGMTAHPKIDPETGEMVWFRSSWAEPQLTYGVADAGGVSTVEQTVPLSDPAAPMMHDFAITERYSLLLDLSVAYDLSLFERGVAIPIRWHDERSAKIGVIRREGGEVRWFSIRPCFIQHVANAFELNEDRIVLDAVRFESFLKFDDATGTFAPNPLGQLWRFEIDLASGSVAERAISLEHIEMPRINEAHTGRPYRYVYSVLQPTDQEMRGVARINLGSGSVQKWVPPPGDQNSEPVFVPDPDRTSAEDGGWLLVCAYRTETDTSDLVILDAQESGDSGDGLSCQDGFPPVFTAPGQYISLACDLQQAYAAATCFAVNIYGPWCRCGRKDHAGCGAAGAAGLYSLRAEPLKGLDEWLEPYRRYWSERLDALEARLPRQQGDPNTGRD